MTLIESFTEIVNNAKSIDEGRHVDALKAVTKLNNDIRRLLTNAPTDANIEEERAFWAMIDALKKEREKLYSTRF